MNELLSLAPPSPWQPSGAPASSLSCPSWSTSRGWTSGPGSLRFRPSRSSPRTRSAWPWMPSSSIGFLNRCERLASCRCLWCLVVGRFWVLQVTFGTCGYFPIRFWTCCRTTMWASAGLPPPPSAPSSAPTLSRLCSVKGTEQPACLFFFGKWTNVFIYLGLQGQYFEDSIAGTEFWKSDCRDSILKIRLQGQYVENPIAGTVFSKSNCRDSILKIWLQGQYCLKGDDSVYCRLQSLGNLCWESWGKRRKQN